LFKNADLFLCVASFPDRQVLTLFKIRHAISWTNGRANWSPGCFHSTDPRTSSTGLWGLQSSRQGMICGLFCH
jgi:hypothetical protein